MKLNALAKTRGPRRRVSEVSSLCLSKSSNRFHLPVGDAVLLSISARVLDVVLPEHVEVCDLAFRQLPLDARRHAHDERARWDDSPRAEERARRHKGFFADAAAVQHD